MKKLLLSTLFIVLVLSAETGFAKSKKDEMDKCQVSAGTGSLMVEVKSKLTISVKNEEGKLIISEITSTDSGKLQLLGLESGFYEVEIKNKKASKTFRVEVQ